MRSTSTMIYESHMHGHSIQLIVQAQMLLSILYVQLEEQTKQSVGTGSVL